MALDWKQEAERELLYLKTRLEELEGGLADLQKAQQDAREVPHDFWQQQIGAFRAEITHLKRHITQREEISTPSPSK